MNCAFAPPSRGRERDPRAPALPARANKRRRKRFIKFHRIENSADSDTCPSKRVRFRSRIKSSLAIILCKFERIVNRSPERTALLCSEQIVLYSRTGDEAPPPTPRRILSCELTDDSFMNPAFTFKLKVRILMSTSSRKENCVRGYCRLVFASRPHDTNALLAFATPLPSPLALV